MEKIAVGNGQILAGRSGNQNTEGLKVRYTGEDASEEAGLSQFFKILWIFQTGSNAGQTVSVSLRDMKASSLEQAWPTRADSSLGRH